MTSWDADETRYFWALDPYDLIGESCRVLEPMVFQSSSVGSDEIPGPQGMETRAASPLL